MNKQFDLRQQRDREELAGFLPTFDSRTIVVPPCVFVEALQDACAFLGSPDWLVYQWGVVGPFLNGKTQHPLELARLVELGPELRDLSRHENLEALLAGFRNPPQFFDTMFEVHTASFFSRLNTTKHLRFAPVHVVRDREKRPDFDVVSETGVFSVECKRPHLHVQRAAKIFQATANAIHSALNAVDWSRDARIEVELLAPLRELPASFARRLVASALGVWQNGQTEFVDNSARVYVVPRESPFRIVDYKFGQDIMVIDSVEATGLFNPRKTMMRLVHNSLDHKFARSAGVRIAEALRQLPPHHHGIIVLGDVPRRIAEKAVIRRLGDAAYAAVVAFVVHENNEFHFTYQKEHHNFIQEMVGAGVRPLFSSA